MRQTEPTLVTDSRKFAIGITKQSCRAKKKHDHLNNLHMLTRPYRNECHFCLLFEGEIKRGGKLKKEEADQIW